MSAAKKIVPAVEGWFTMDESAPHLLGTRCKKCGTFFFPREQTFCRNPGCGGTDMEAAKLSNRGKLWSFTNNCYQPPAPYVSPDPFVPYAIAAVELGEEKMVVLGQVVSGVDIAALRAGMSMQLVLEKLYEDDENEYVVWKWKPVTTD